MKLRNRVILGLGAVAVAFAVVGFLIVNTQRRYSVQQLDRQLQAAIPIAFSQFARARSRCPPRERRRSASCSSADCRRTAR